MRTHHPLTEYKMNRIEPDQWLTAVFAEGRLLADVLRNPVDGYDAMSPKEKDALRQSQTESDEIVRVLGFTGEYALVMKSDTVIGWVLQAEIAINPTLDGFDESLPVPISASDFFAQWEGTPYLWGGTTRLGIDCSGFTQRYYRDVLNRRIPKNSYDQRRLGKSKSLVEVSNDDLFFCTRIGGRGIHHVGIYLDEKVWHAHGELGVIEETRDDYLSRYALLEVVALQ